MEENHFLKSLGVEVDESDTSFLHEFINSVPGIDEAVSFGEIIRQVNDLKFDLVLFDTAPTGHTLRLLNFPNVLDKALVKLLQIKEKLGPMMNQVGTMLNGGDTSTADKFNTIFEKMGDFKDSIESVNQQFQNDKQTTFVAV